VWDWFEKSTVRTMALIRLQKPETQKAIRDGIVQAAAKYKKGDRLTIPCPAVVHSGTKPPKA
jgi:hypothetical protein